MCNNSQECVVVTFYCWENCFVEKVICFPWTTNCFTKGPPTIIVLLWLIFFIHYIHFALHLFFKQRKLFFLLAKTKHATNLVRIHILVSYLLSFIAAIMSSLLFTLFFYKYFHKLELICSIQHLVLIVRTQFPDPSKVLLDHSFDVPWSPKANLKDERDKEQN